MNYSRIKFCDIADGEGVRTSLFVSGCTHYCDECFNPETWNFANGDVFTAAVEDEILESLSKPFCDGLTVLGGEPMEPQNQRALVDFLERVKRECPDKNIWCYTGDIYEDLLDSTSPRHTEVTNRLLGTIDVLVDGPYQKENHDITLRFRGSSNQRVIDVPASRAAGRVVLWHDDPEFETHTM